MSSALPQGWKVEDDDVAPLQSQLPQGWTVEEDKPQKPERSFLEKTGRAAEQYGLGMIQGSVPGVVYDLAVAPLANQDAQEVAYRENLFGDIERLQEKKNSGQWDKQDEELMNNLVDQVKNPQKSKEFINTADVSIRGLAEKATGQNLEPEGFLENAANWIGRIQKGKANLESIGLNPKDILKALVPTGTEVSRGLGAASGIEYAKDGKFGPLGTIASTVVGDLIGRDIYQGGKSLIQAAKNPKQAAAQVFSKATMNENRRAVATELARDFEKSGMQADAGTLTQSPLVQMMQARLSQSGLTGEPLENLRKDLSNQVTREYKKITDDLGEVKFENDYQASQAILNALKVEEQALNINKESLTDQAKRARPLEGRISVEEQPAYQNQFLDRISPAVIESTAQKGQDLKTAALDIKTPLKEEFNERFTQFRNETQNIDAGPQNQLVRELNNFIESHQGSLLLGESAPEARVLNAAQTLLDTLAPEGGFRGVSLNELIKTKQTLGDVANYEFGGSNFESAYKKLTGDLDQAINRALSNNPELRSQYLHLNADYSAFKDEFESENLKNLFEPKNINYNTIYNQFVNNPDKLRSLEDIMHGNERGLQLINQVKRDHAQEIINRPNLTAQDIADLQNTLGPEYANDILTFITERQRQIENPLPRAARQESLPIRPGAIARPERPTLKGRGVSETGVERSRQGLRKKLLENLTDKKTGQPKKSSDIMNQMDTIEGIRKLKQVLNTTPEGRELFKELARYKIAQLIDKKMSDSVSEQVTLGTFSKLLDTQKTKDIVRELLGEAQFKKLQLLQKNSGKLAESASKFFNASKSGTSLVDVGAIAAIVQGIAGIFTGNPFLFMSAASALGGSYGAAKLLADPVFLKELEKAVTTKNPSKLPEYLMRIAESIARATQKELTK